MKTDNLIGSKQTKLIDYNLNQVTTTSIRIICPLALLLYLVDLYTGHHYLFVWLGKKTKANLFQEISKYIIIRWTIP